MNDHTHDDRWLSSLDGYLTDPGPMPSVDEPGVRQLAKQYQDDCYAARFEQDVAAAVDRLGWMRVNAIIDHVKTFK